MSTSLCAYVFLRAKSVGSMSDAFLGIFGGSYRRGDVFRITSIKRLPPMTESAYGSRARVGNKMRGPTRFAPVDFDFDFNILLVLIFAQCTFDFERTYRYFTLARWLSARLHFDDRAHLRVPMRLRYAYALCE